MPAMHEAFVWIGGALVVAGTLLSLLGAAGDRKSVV
jgi:cytochrome c biogenesis factor